MHQIKKKVNQIHETRQLQRAGRSMSPPTFQLDAHQEAGSDPKAPAEDNTTYGAVENGELYRRGSGDSDAVALNDVRQGSLANCYFLAAVGALAQSNPDAIRSMITNNGDGTYNVRLFGNENIWGNRSAETYRVTAELPQFSRNRVAYAQLGDGPELWVALIEKAFAMREGGYEDTEWGNSGEAMEIITGQDHVTVETKNHSASEIGTRIHALLEANKPVTAQSIDVGESAKGPAASSAGVVGKHVYVVERVDIEGQTIDLYNPWGRQHLRGLSLSDFKSYFWKFQSN